MLKLTVVAGACAIGLVVLLGLYLFVKGARNVQRAVASSAWPKTSGVVVGSDTTVTRSRDEEDRRTSVTYSTNTTVRYHAGGRDYTTNVIHFGQTLGSGDASEAALQRIRYGRGAEVSVSYHPREPWVAVVRPGLHADAFWLPGAGLAFLLPAVMALIMLPSMTRDIRGDGDGDGQSFESRVQNAIEDAKRGVAPRDPFPVPPMGVGGDSAMAVVAGIFAGIFCTLGVLALTSGLQKMWCGWASEGWLTAPGVIVSSGKASNRSSELVYRYEVAGAKHFNNLRRFGATAAEDEEAYPVGAKVRVAYSRTDPDVSVLEPGVGRDALWLPGIGVVALLFSLATFIWVVPSIASGR